MKLYFTPGACSMASHIILNELGAAHQTEQVDLKTHKTVNEEDFYKINPKGYVPALILDDGQTLTENIAILAYLDDLNLNKANLNGYRLLEWLAFISTELHKTLGSLFALGNAPKEVVQAIKDKAAKRFDLVDKHLSGKEYVFGNSFGVADAYLFTVLNWCGHFNIDLKPWKNISSFMQRMQARPSVQKTLKAEGLLK